MEILNLIYISAEQDSGNICPACPKVSSCGVIGVLGSIQPCELLKFLPHLIVLRRLEVVLFQWMPSLEFHEKSLQVRATRIHFMLISSSKTSNYLMNMLLLLHKGTEQMK